MRTCRPIRWVFQGGKMNTRTFVLNCALPGVVLLVPVLLASCVIEGKSSGQMRKTMLNSFLFQSTDIFYPNGVPEDPNEIYPILEEKQIKAIAKSMKGQLESLKKQHARRHAVLSDYLQSSFPKKIPGRLFITNERKPLAHVESNGDITIDVLVIQAMFRASLLCGLSESDSPFSSDEPVTGRTDEHALLAEFFELKHKVKITKGHTILGDLFLPLMGDGLESPWFKMVDYAKTSDRISFRYYGVLCFLLAHEFGHIAFGHVDMADPRDENTFQRRELEADAYAAILLADRLGAVNLFGGGFFGYDALTGYETFFTLGYQLAGFREKYNLGGFRYPAVQTRLELAREAHSKVLDRIDAAVAEAFHEAFEKAMESVDEN